MPLPQTTPHDYARRPIQQVHDYRSLTNISEEALGPWLKEAAQNGKRVWECRSCGQHFVRRQHGYNHVLKQHFNQEKLFECRIWYRVLFFCTVHTPADSSTY